MFTNRSALPGSLPGVCAVWLAFAGPACSNETTTPPVDSSPDVTVVVDGAMIHQTFFGFGATHIPLVWEGLGDALDPDLRAEATAAVYSSVGITTGNLQMHLLERAGEGAESRNDNDDPFLIDWAGFDTFRPDAIKTKVLDLAEPVGLRDYFPEVKVNLNQTGPWLRELREVDYDRYLDEAAEQVVAGWTHLRNTLGLNPGLLELLNEPLSGNRELAGGSEQEIVDLVKRVGKRLEQAGFPGVRFVVPNGTNEWVSLSVARAILADPEARRFVGAIGYHPYPYDSPYANIEKLLATSGQGNPDPDRLAARAQLRALAQAHGLPLWMTEVSTGGVDPLSMDDLRGRAIHIHDELVYADVSAYFGMSAMWDRVSHRFHTGNDNFLKSEGHMVLIDNDNRTVYITGMGHAVGHYARWIKRGAVRLEATSDDPLVQVTAFRSEGRLVLVLINNADVERSVGIGVRDLVVRGEISGERSVAGAYRAGLIPFTPETGTSVRTVLPAESVTTLSGELGPG